MTVPAPSASRTGTPTRIGGARPSHLVTTGGVGAMIDLPGMSVIVRGTDTWPLERSATIVEPRLLGQVRATLGQHVRTLQHAPWDAKDSEDPWTRTGVPVSPFPTWLRCPACHRLGPLDDQQFELVHRSGKRPDLAKWVHSTCLKQTQKRPLRRRACIPARFVVVCDAGHLDDFPYVEFVHHGAQQACAGPRLTMRDSSTTLGPRVQVKCAECGESENVARAAGKSGHERLPVCRGRHPHLQRFEACDKPLRLMVLGASNMWFSVTASALHLPSEQSVEDLVARNWEVLGAQPNVQVAGLVISGMEQLRDLRSTAIEEVWATIEKLRSAGGPSEEIVAGDLLRAEWELLAHPTTDRQDEDFQARPTPPPAGYDRLVSHVVQVHRLREVQALLGFTRLQAAERRELEPANRLPLGRRDTTWVPAFEQRGEGVFLQLPGDRVAAWAARVADHPRVEALRDAYAHWSTNRERPPDSGFPIPRYLLLHTLSHLLIRQVALECGYSSASIRERLYVGTPEEPATGILLSTAASDSEGTLGGLVSLGEAKHLGRLLELAMEDAGRCSSDPLCAEHVPQDPSETLHAAACHACLFVSETSCETNNRWLDRAVLVDMGDGLAYDW